MLAIEAIHVQVDHLQEAAREKFHREEVFEAAEYLVLALGACAADQRFEFHALRQLGAPEKIRVAVRHRAHTLIRAKILDVRLHQRRVLAKKLHFRLLLRHNFVHYLALCRRLLGGCGQRQAAERQRKR